MVPDAMRVQITVHLRVAGGLLRLSLDPTDVSSYDDIDRLQRFAAHRARSWLANGDVSVFSAGLDKRYNVVVLPPVHEDTDSLPKEIALDVYCVESNPTGGGIKVSEVAIQMQSVFQLTGMRKELIVPWITGRDGECSSDSDKAFRDYPPTEETLYEPGSVFLVRSDNESISTTSKLPLTPAPANSDMNFREAFRETEGPHAKDHSLVGVPFSSRRLVPTSLSKSDQTRRDPITTRQTPPTSVITAPPIHAHKYLVGGSQRQSTPGTPRKTDGKSDHSDLLSVKDLVSEAGRDQSAVVDVPLRLEAEGGARDVSEGTQKGSSEGGDGGESGDGGEDVGSALKIPSSPPGRAQLTNGLDLPQVRVDAADTGETIVPGVNYMCKLSRVPHNGASTCTSTNSDIAGQKAESIKRVSSFPKMTSTKPAKHRDTLRNAKSFDVVPTLSESHSQFEEEKGEGIVVTVGQSEGDKEGEREEEEREGEGDAEQKREGVEGDGIVNTLAVPPTSPRMPKLREEQKVQCAHYMCEESAGAQRGVDLKRIHALEHACNGSEGACHMAEQHLNLCSEWYDKVMVDDMLQRLHTYKEGGPLDEEVRSLIVLHCRNCRDPGCNVPHAAAGCCPAGKSYTPTPSLRFSNKTLSTSAARHTSPTPSAPSNTSPPPSITPHTSQPSSIPHTSPPSFTPPHTSQSPSSPPHSPPPPTLPLHTSPPPSTPPPTSPPTSKPQTSPPFTHPHTSPPPSTPPQTSTPPFIPPHTTPPPSTPPQTSTPPFTPPQTSLPPFIPPHTSPPLSTLPHTLQHPIGISSVDFDIHPANISISSPRPFPTKGIAQVSFDLEPANISDSPTPKTTSPGLHTATHHPTTVHTISDSPHHHMTHLPLMPPHRPKTDVNSEMIVPTMYMPQNGKLENTLMQGTFSHKRPSNVVPIDRPSPSVAQATDDVRVVEKMPDPPPVTSLKASRREPAIWRSIIPGKFPTAKQLDSDHVIFSRIDDVIAGSPLRIAHLEKSHRLGKGGNGRIFQYPLLEKEYAVKHTAYRPGELSEWKLFDHSNVIQLLMCSFMTENYCGQFMPLMDGSLSREIRDTCYRGVTSLYLQRGAPQTELMCNAQHILRSVVKGTSYLHDDMSIQHVDLKASNILIKKRCVCGDIFTCVCPESDKCLVKLADFDSVKPFQQKESMSLCREEWKPYVPMTEEECGEVMGTPGYRAPEQFMKLVPVVSPDHCLFGKGLEGPWTDIWNVGHICLTIFLGPNKPEERQEAWTVHCRPYSEHFSRTYVGPELTHSFLRLLNLSLFKPRDAFSTVSDFVRDCFQCDFRKRPRARDLLDHELLSTQYSLS